MRFLALSILLCGVSAACGDDGTKSVLADSTASTQEAATGAVPTQVNCGKTPSLTYSGRNRIAPCAVSKNACLSYCEKGCDACCNPVFTSVNLEVPICVPPCPSKETVTRSRNGKRAVYDFGRHEVVLKANDDGDVSVRYRKRLLDR